MFDSITILQSVSLGQLAETLLFYGKVTLFVDENLIRSLCRKLGPQVLIDFLERHSDGLELRCITWKIWSSTWHGHPQVHLTLGDERTVCVDEPYLDYLRRTSTLDTPSGYVVDPALTEKLLGLIQTEHTEGTHFSDVLNQELVDNTLPALCEAYLKRHDRGQRLILPKGLAFTLEGTGGRYTVSFSARSRLSHSQNRLLVDLTSTYITTVSEMPIWSNRSSELLVDMKRSFFIEEKIKALVHRVNQSNGELQAFNHAVLGNSKALAEAIDRGARSFSEFLTLYEKASKFRKWLNGLPFDANLASEYLREVTSEGWSAALPAKVARWALFTGAGLGIDLLGAGGIGTLAGLGLSALDAFLVDSLLRGWRPNQFVAQELSRFVRFD